MSTDMFPQGFIDYMLKHGVDHTDKKLCGHNGGIGIGAGHTCVCNAQKGHSLDEPRPHGCSCGAMWVDKKP